MDWARPKANTAYCKAVRNMLTDDFFEGWLSVPAMEGMLNIETPNLQRNVSVPFCVDKNDTKQIPREENGSNATRVHNKLRSVLSSSDTACVEPSARKRRGHAKSRLGCTSCKNRKVKCQETWPSCANCIKRGCRCTYPAVFKYTQHEPIIPEQLKMTPRYIQMSDSPMPATYNANDMRLFHHFIIAAHPCIPCEYETVWIRDVPTFSHQYDYLLHGMLAIAGSHLDMFIDNPRGHTALIHRQKAIVGLEKAFTRWPPTANEAHVMLATSYLLAFQSSYLPDGLLDHILSLRGCALLSQLILSNQLEGAFAIDPKMHGAWLGLRIENFPVFDQELAREALHSIADLSPHLESSKALDIERAIIAQLAEILRPLLVSADDLDLSGSVGPGLTTSQASSTMKEADHTSTSFTSATRNPLFPAELAMKFEDITCWDTITEVPTNQRPDPHRSFSALMTSLLILTTWPHEQVLALFSPKNTLGSVVVAHFCCTRFLTSPLWAPESAMRTTPMKAMVEWCEKVVGGVKDDEEVQWTRYIKWPKKILATLRCLLNRNSGLTLGQLHDALRENPAAFREGKPVQL